MAVVTQKLTTEKFITQNLTKDVILHCPRCGEVMICDPQNFWRCPCCGGEWWDDESRLQEIESQETERQMQEALRLQFRWCLGRGYAEVLPLVPVIDPRSRGSRSRRQKKPLPIKRPNWELL